MDLHDASSLQNFSLPQLQAVSDSLISERLLDRKHIGPMNFFRTFPSGHSPSKTDELRSEERSQYQTSGSLRDHENRSGDLIGKVSSPGLVLKSHTGFVSLQVIDFA